MFGRSQALFLSLLTLQATSAACTSLAQPERSSESVCSASQAARSLRLVQLSAGDLKNQISWAAGKDVGTVEVTEGALITGECADAVEHFHVRNLYLTTGGVLEVTPLGLEVTDRGPSIASKTLPAGGPRPKGGGDLVMAYRFDTTSSPGGPFAAYIGVWRTRSGSAIRLFTEQPGGGFTQPRTVLEGRFEARSVTYFPAVDTPSGRLDIVYRIEPQQTGIITFRWSHPGVY
jgi:hypothetical protein